MIPFPSATADLGKAGPHSEKSFPWNKGQKRKVKDQLLPTLCLTTTLAMDSYVRIRDEGLKSNSLENIPIKASLSMCYLVPCFAWTQVASEMWTS